MNQCITEKSLEFGVILQAAQGAIAGYQVLINHTGDEDLKKVFRKSYRK